MIKTRMARRVVLPLAIIFATAITETAAIAQTVPSVLFVGNSYTHGRYQPVLGYNAADAGYVGNDYVHDLLCPGTSVGTGTCTSGAEAVAAVTPTTANTPTLNGSGLTGQLNYLQANASKQYTEVGPFSGAAGMFLQFTKDAGLTYNVSIISVSSATLQGYVTGTSKADLPLITGSGAQQIVLQDQTFEPLPTTINVNGTTVPTRGNPTNFVSGVNSIINDVNTAQGNTNTKFTLYETPPLAAYGYTSSNPAQPIFGSSTQASQGGNKAYAPYIGDANPIAAMASDLHNAYVNEAASAALTYHNSVNVALAGDAWVSAINLGFAQQNPFLVNEPAGQVDLWDSNPLLACCTTPVGYHPSLYGDYLNALTLFYTLTGINPLTLANEFNPNDPNYDNSVSDQLGIAPDIAYDLAYAAFETESTGEPVPEPRSLAMMAIGLLGLLAARHRLKRA